MTLILGCAENVVESTHMNLPPEGYVGHLRTKALAAVDSAF
jgi:hypothetical protein